MFNINRILNRKGDSGRSPIRAAPVILDGRSGGAPIEANNAEESVDGRNAEGFLCPLCYQAFPTGDSLQNHYECAHPDTVATVLADGRAAFPCPVCKMCLGSEAELNAHYKRHHSNEKEQGEIEALRAQVTALQDGKSLVVEELQLLQNELTEMTKENSKIRDTRDTLEQKTASLAGELAYLKAELDETTSQKSCLESKLLKAQEKVRELEIEIQQRPEADDVSVLKQEIVSVQKMMDQLTLQREAEKDALQRQCSNLQEYCNRLQSENLTLEDTLKAAPKSDDVKSLEENVARMKSRIAELQKKLDVIASEKGELQKTLQKFSNYNDLKRVLSEKDAQLQDANRHLETKEELVRKLSNDLKSEKENVERMKVGAEKLYAKIEEGEGANTAILQLKEENTRLQEQFIHSKNLAAQMTQENEAKLEALRTKLKQVKVEAENVKKKNGDLNGALAKVQEQFNCTEKEKAQLIAQLKDQEKNIASLQESHRESLRKVQDELSHTRKRLEDKSKSLHSATVSLQRLQETHMEHIETQQQLSDSLESAIKEMNDLKARNGSEISRMKLEMEKLEKSRNELVTKCSWEEEKCKSLNSQYCDLQTQNKESILKLEKAMQQLANHQSEKNELEMRLNKLKEELQKNQENEAQLLSSIEGLNEIKKELSEKISVYDKEVTELRTSVKMLSCEKETMLKQVEDMKTELSEKRELCDFQENKIAELTECYQDEKENRCREVQSLESAKQLLISQKMALLKDIESVKEENAKKVTSLQEKITGLESEIQKMEVANKAIASKLENSIQSKKECKEEWDKIQSHLQAQIGVLNENAQTLREDLQAEQNKREIMEQKVDELSGSKLELEAKLDNALDERKSLLDRCLKRETECEKLQKSTAELRRKLDDTTAALQELGRENQTLQIENTKHLARKWTDDSAVTHCTACGKLFTVTVRKHHCRNCGNIFCNECSSRTAAIASSKKPVRVCDLCCAEVSK